MKRRVFTAILVVLTLFFSCTTTESLAKHHYPHTVLAAEPGRLTIPWEEDARAVAQESGTVRFYFMSSEGQAMDASGSKKFGDSALIVFPNGEVMLVDGGMAAYGKTLVENLRLLGIEQIDYLVLSHMHNDHYGGLITADGVLANFPVKHFYWNGTLNLKADVVEYFNRVMGQYDFEKTILSRGDSLVIGEAQLEVLNPPESEVGGSYGTIGLNNTSLTFKLTFGDFSALFGGDLYIEREFDLISLYGADLAVDLIKIHHHGRNTSNSKFWANATAPLIAVATSGNQIDEIVYADYTRAGAHVYTDVLDGYVRVVTDGKTGTVTTSRKRTSTLFAEWEAIAQ